jgi:hypothetical protein
MITATKRARERARAERWMVSPTKRAMVREGNGKGGKRFGNGNSGGRQ